MQMASGLLASGLLEACTKHQPQSQVLFATAQKRDAVPPSSLCSLQPHHHVVHHMQFAITNGNIIKLSTSQNHGLRVLATHKYSLSAGGQCTK